MTAYISYLILGDSSEILTLLDRPAAATYSASVDDNATMDCFLADQLTRHPPSFKQNAYMDFLSRVSVDRPIGIQHADVAYEISGLVQLPNQRRQRTNIRHTIPEI